MTVQVQVPAQRLIGKAEYAARFGRHPSAVSHWIRDGKLRAPALVGSGRYAKIDWREADRMLAEELDPGQQYAQQSSVYGASVYEAELDEEEDFDDPPAGRASGGSRSALASSDRQRQLKARADREESEAHLALVKLQKETGRWVEVEAAERAWSQESAKIIDRIEGSFGQLADELAAGERDARSILLALRKWFRDVRAGVSADAASFAADLEAAAAEMADDLAADEETAAGVEAEAGTEDQDEAA